MNFIEMDATNRVAYGIAVATVGIAMMNSASDDDEFKKLAKDFAVYSAEVLSTIGSADDSLTDTFKDSVNKVRKMLEDKAFKMTDATYEDIEKMLKED